MDAARRALILQRWNVVRHELPPRTEERRRHADAREWARIEEFTGSTWCGVGRPPHERAWLANAFVAKAVLELTTTAGLLGVLLLSMHFESQNLGKIERLNLII